MIVFTESDDALARQLLWVIRVGARALHSDGVMLPSPLSDLYEALTAWVNEPRASLSDTERQDTGLVGASADDGGHENLLTYDGAAKRVNMSPSWIRARVREGELRFVQLGRGRRIAVEDLDAFVEARKSWGPS